MNLQVAIEQSLILLSQYWKTRQLDSTKKYFALWVLILSLPTILYKNNQIITVKITSIIYQLKSSYE